MAKTRQELEIELEAAIKDYGRAQKRVVRLRNSISKIVTAEAAAQPMTLERAMVVYLDDGHTENTAGYKFLQDLSWKGEWYKTGLRSSGSHWPNSNQRCLDLALDYTWDTAKLAHLEQLMRDVLPILKTNIYYTRDQGGQSMMIGSHDKKVAPIDGQTLKVFNIFEHDLSAGGDWQFGVLPDDSAIVFDARRPRYGLAKAGTIGECLEYVRERLWYEGGESNDYDYDDDED